VAGFGRFAKPFAQLNAVHARHDEAQHKWHSGLRCGAMSMHSFASAAVLTANPSSTSMSVISSMNQRRVFHDEDVWRTVGRLSPGVLSDSLAHRIEKILAHYRQHQHSVRMHHVQPRFPVDAFLGGEKNDRNVCRLGKKMQPPAQLKPFGGGRKRVQDNRIGFQPPRFIDAGFPVGGDGQ